jgi:glucose-6-phosphate dehydrogenase assembly protein OpcA
MEEAMTAISPPAAPSAVLSRVEKELRDLYDPLPGGSGEPARARACTMNLVVVAGTRAIADRYTPVVDEVTRVIPSRAIVVALDPDAPDDALEADTTAVCTKGEEGQIVCSERVRLAALGTICHRVGSAVEALCVPEIPTTLVWLGRVRVDDPVFQSVAANAQRIVLDTDYTSLGSLLRLAKWARETPGRPHVADLAWTRVATWQELCARFFDEPRLHALAMNVTRVSIRQASEPQARVGSEGALLLGWMATRLGWKASRAGGALRLERPERATVELALGTVKRPPQVAPCALSDVVLEAEQGDVKLTGTIRRELASGLTDATPDADVLVWHLNVAGAPPLEQRVRLSANKGARVLERTLHRPTDDPALTEAVSFAQEVFEDGVVCS